QGVLPQSRVHRRVLYRGRLVSHGRCRLSGHRWSAKDHRPCQGRGQTGRWLLVCTQVHREQAQVLPLHQGSRGFGDGQEEVCAFINIDLEAVGNWAERRNLPYAGYTDLAGKPEVYALIRDCVTQVNADLANDPKLAGSRISAFLILHKELDPDDDELTRTRKVRRGFIAQ